MITIRMTQAQRGEWMSHLGVSTKQAEQGAFLTATWNAVDEVLTVRDLILLHGESYDGQGHDQLSMRPDVLGDLIRLAHESGVALIESHTHPFPGAWATAFSAYDLYGLQESAPHVLWRLPGRPYTAIVVSPNGYDALTWRHRDLPQRISGIDIEGVFLEPSNLTSLDFQ